MSDFRSIGELVGGVVAKMARVTEPGAYLDLPEEIYHANCTPAPALSAGFAWRIVKPGGCPALAWHASPLNPDHEAEQKREFDIGKAAHLLFLEPQHFDARVVVVRFDDYRKDAAKAARDQARLAGKVPLLSHEAEMVAAMRRALRNETEGLPFRTAPSFAKDGFEGGRAEVSYFWRSHGLWCKARPDYVKPGLLASTAILVDYKTSGDDELDRVAWKTGWHVRAAHYVEGHKALTGEAAEYWYIAQLKKAPYLTEVCKLDSDSLEWGRIQLASAKARFARCLRTGQWPAYPDRATVIALPKWAQMQLQDRHDRGEFDASDLYEIAREFNAPLGIEGEI